MILNELEQLMLIDVGRHENENYTHTLVFRTRALLNIQEIPES